MTRRQESDLNISTRLHSTSGNSSFSATDIKTFLTSWNFFLLLLCMPLSNCHAKCGALLDYSHLSTSLPSADWYVAVHHSDKGPDRTNAKAWCKNFKSLKVLQKILISHVLCISILKQDFWSARKGILVSILTNVQEILLSQHRNSCKI